MERVSWSVLTAGLAGSSGGGDKTNVACARPASLKKPIGRHGSGELAQPGWRQCTGPGRLPRRKRWADSSQRVIPPGQAVATLDGLAVRIRSNAGAGPLAPRGLCRPCRHLGMKTGVSRAPRGKACAHGICRSLVATMVRTADFRMPETWKHPKIPQFTGARRRRIVRAVTRGSEKATRVCRSQSSNEAARLSGGSS